MIQIAIGPVGSMVFTIGSPHDQHAVGKTFRREVLVLYYFGDVIFGLSGSPHRNAAESHLGRAVKIPLAVNTITILIPLAVNIRVVSIGRPIIGAT